MASIVKVKRPSGLKNNPSLQKHFLYLRRKERKTSITSKPIKANSRLLKIRQPNVSDELIKELVGINFDYLMRGGDIDLLGSINKYNVFDIILEKQGFAGSRRKFKKTLSYNSETGDFLHLSIKYDYNYDCFDKDCERMPKLRIFLNKGKNLQNKEIQKDFESLYFNWHYFNNQALTVEQILELKKDIDVLVKIAQRTSVDGLFKYKER